MTRSAFSRRLVGALRMHLPWLALLLLPVSAIAQTPADETPTYTRIQAGHSAMWYDPARSGEGWMLEVLPDDGAVVYWFTFDDEGNPRWLGGNGTIVRSEAGDELRFESLYAVHGPRFGPEFDPDDAVREDIGSAIFRFQDCNNGEIAFDAYGRQASYPLTRLTRTMGANGCRPIHGTPGEPVQPYAGQSGSWFDPASSGQGFTLAWLANGDAALVWFTFDAEGKPYWMTAIGQPEDDKIVFPELLSVQGGRFAEAFDPEAVTRTPWGRMELTLECDTGQASYFPTEDGFAKGQLDLQRLTRLESPACPWVKPKLTDLYDIVVTELPASVPVDPNPTQPGSGDLVFPVGVANEGTVVALKKTYWGHMMVFKAQRVRPGEADWSDVYGMYVNGVFVAADGNDMLVDRMTGGPALIRGGDILPIPGLEGAESNDLVDVSDDLSNVLGRSIVRLESGHGIQKYWVGGVDKAAVQLPVSDEFPGPAGRCISNDGSTVVGRHGQVRVGNNPTWSIRWEGGAPPRYLHDVEGVPLADPTACSGDTSIVYGTLPIEADEDGNWLRGMPGYITRDGRSGHLGAIAASAEQRFGWLHAVTATSSDGTLTGGGYSSPDMQNALPNGGRAWGALLWTQDTGHVLLTDLLEDLEFLSGWQSMAVARISPNGEYFILSTGEIFEAAPPPLYTGGRSSIRAALVRLVRKP